MFQPLATPLCADVTTGKHYWSLRKKVMEGGELEHRVCSSESRLCTGEALCGLRLMVFFWYTCTAVFDLYVNYYLHVAVLSTFVSAE